MHKDLGGYQVTPAGVLVLDWPVEWIELEQPHGPESRLIVGTAHGVLALKRNPAWEYPARRTP